MITGTTTVIAHLGFPTEGFKAPLVYNPWFERSGIDAVVVPLGVRAEHYEAALKALFTIDNVRGALVTMPHKITTVALLDEVTPAVAIAGSCNAVLRREDGTLLGDLFDGVGFVRGVARKGVALEGRRALLVGSGGVGSAIAAALAAAGVGALGLHDLVEDRVAGLAERLRVHHPGLDVHRAARDPSGYDLVVNATPLGAGEGDALPVDVERLGPATFVGEVVMRETLTPFLRAARDRGCAIQVGTDMLFEMIPAYLEFFGFGTATPEALRAVAKLA